MNTKAQISPVAKFILWAVIIVIFLWAFYNLILKPIIEVKDLTKCNVPGIGEGACRDTCEPEETVKVKGLQCKDPEPWCCIVQKTEEDYNGIPKKFLFDVWNIGIHSNSLKNGEPCVADPPSSDANFKCTAGTITVKMDVKNMGEVDMDFYANPVAVLEGKSFGDGGELFGDGPSTPITPGQTTMLTAEITNLVAGNTYKVYAATKCNTGACLDVSEDGIWQYNKYKWLTITIVK